MGDRRGGRSVDSASRRNGWCRKSSRWRRALFVRRADVQADVGLSVFMERPPPGNGARHLSRGVACTGARPSRRSQAHSAIWAKPDRATADRTPQRCGGKDVWCRRRRLPCGNSPQWRNEKHREQWRISIEDGMAALRPKMVAAIDTEVVLAVLKPTWLEKPESAQRLRTRIEVVLDAAKAQGLRDGENPARWRGHLQHLLPSARTSRKAIMPPCPIRTRRHSSPASERRTISRRGRSNSPC